jgi:hypothetical protein
LIWDVISSALSNSGKKSRNPALMLGAEFVHLLQMIVEHLLQNGGVCAH